MTVQNYLKTVPNDIVISTMDRDLVNERVLYLVDEYESMIDEGYNLPAIDDTTTTGQLKDNLNEFSLTNPQEVREFLLDFADNFLAKTPELKEKKKEITDKQTKHMYITYLLGFFSMLLIVMVIGGLITGAFSFTTAFTSIMNFFGSLVNAIF